jgi:hypothetical protein
MSDKYGVIMVGILCVSATVLILGCYYISTLKTIAFVEHGYTQQLSVGRNYNR